MKAAIVSEYRKFFSTRMWWVLTLTMVVFFLLASFAMSWAFGHQTAQNDLPVDALDGLRDAVYGLAPSMGYIFPVIIGALAVTAEYRHNTILPAFSGEPRRWVVMIAKTIAAVPMGFVIAVASTAACMIGGGIGFHIEGIATQLMTASTLKYAALSILALTIWALVGVGLGMLIINQVGVILTVLGFCLIVEPILSNVLRYFPTTASWPKYFPSAASGSLAGGHNIYITIGDAAGGAYPVLTAWQGGLVLAAYGVVFGLLGYFLRIRRDVS